MFILYSRTLRGEYLEHQHVCFSQNNAFGMFPCQPPGYTDDRMSMVRLPPQATCDLAFAADFTFPNYVKIARGSFEPPLTEDGLLD